MPDNGDHTRIHQLLRHLLGSGFVGLVVHSHDFKCDGFPLDLVAFLVELFPPPALRR